MHNFASMFLCVQNLLHLDVYCFHPRRQDCYNRRQLFGLVFFGLFNELLLILKSYTKDNLLIK
jgi:hypothetical protein